MIFTSLVITRREKSLLTLQKLIKVLRMTDFMCTFSSVYFVKEMRVKDYEKFTVKNIKYEI